MAGKPVATVVAVYRKPADPAKFDRYYADVHTPLVKKMPGLRGLEVTRVTGGGSDVYQMAVLTFDDPAARDRALGSPEGKTVVDDLPKFAAGIVSVYMGETRQP